jgi:hypothetical protein
MKKSMASNVSVTVGERWMMRGSTSTLSQKQGQDGQRQLDRLGEAVEGILGPGTRLKSSIACHEALHAG